jgi:universal stress protein E
VDTIARPQGISSWFRDSSDSVFEFIVSQKQERLEKYAVPFRDAGLDVTTHLLIGQASHEIAKFAGAEDADLVIRYRKGLSSRVRGRFGNTARNLMRICPCPLLLTGESPLSDPKVLACINVEHAATENEAILGASRDLAADAGIWRVVFCWKFLGEEHLEEYLDKRVMADYRLDAEHNYQRLFEKFLASHDLSQEKDRVQMQQGDPIALIPSICRDEAVDVVVMSSASQNHPLHRLLGSTVESILDELPCALMLVKPIGFRSPFKTLEQPTGTT